ncbi:MAG TPA: hypothetical protein VGE35_03070 [Candidatus Paceibacterota bacterium]
MTDRRKVKRWIKIWAIVAVAALVIGYGIFRAMSFIEGPDIGIDSPANGATLAESLVEVKGFARNISFLTLNGEKIFTDESGVFSEQVLLSYGYNIMTLEAKDRFGRTAQKTLQLIYK